MTSTKSPRKPRKKSHEYRFTIKEFSKDRFPMSLLADFLKDLAIIYGHEEQLHFVCLEEGSAVAVARAEPEIDAEIKEQILLVQKNEGPPAAMLARERIEQRLRDYNTTGFISDPQNKKVLKFTGAAQAKFEMPTYGPFNQQGELEGIPIMVGGKDDPVPIHLEDRNGVQHICYAKRDLARQIAQHLFSSFIKVEGIGRWIRLSNGTWELKKFTAKHFEPIKEKTLEEEINELASIPANWKDCENPYNILDTIRYENEVQ